ncbi:hypothetical protein D9758_012361 [Tetrapyrgos nigripes]|uniref:F-box domain-containing protein n=1 Tax=Tetrapyrgos nigripes TaxID=182062 RepID=A0A8H5CM09_9AGAR|nr:hypothetical protein D9758_012361 [Tetrapyrgos nigripes]
MSAKATYAKLVLNLPELPPELWLSIFAFATELHDALNEVQSLFKFPGEVRAIQKYKKSYRSSLVTRRRLLLVCKQWRSLAIPFVYRHLLLERRQTLPLLLRTLWASSRNSQENGETTPFGCYTKRLDICLREDSVDVGPTHGEILYYLPNTEIIVFCGRDYWNYNLPPIFISSLEKAGSSVRVLNWQSPAFSPSVGAHHPILSSTPNLTSLQLHWIGFTANPLLSLPLLPHLRALSLIRLNDPCPDHPEPLLEHTINPFPALTQIRLAPAWLIKDAHVQAILQFCSSTISSVHLSSTSAISLDWSPSLAVLHQSGVRMTSLTLHMYQIFKTPSDDRVILHIPPSVSVLGLSFGQTQASDSVYNCVVKLVTSLKGDGLKVVRLDDRNVPDLWDKHPAVARGFAKALKAQGRRLEFGEGLGLES